VLGRTGVLRGSSGCLNTGSWCFLLVGARETRVSWCSCSLLYRLVLVGASIQSWKHSGSWCFLLVGARETRELVLPSSGC
jgi:hypothetical protein